jgi:hypothetical protein
LEAHRRKPKVEAEPLVSFQLLEVMAGLVLLAEVVQRESPVEVGIGAQVERQEPDRSYLKQQRQ